ncbi:hypothetical protein JCM3774_005401 [Rhodotorula dairenensis]
MPRVVPRKTAWSTRAEFVLVFDRLFASDGDVALQRDAISRIQVWLHRGQCPHAVESTAALLQLILRDAEPSTSSAAHGVSEHELRLSYSMAVIRFVNSLVDPLQTTYYARSIASLAAQIGLPAWFVELRHQATHEDLPSIAVLRDAARQALDWLYANYWLPALDSASATSTLENALPPLPLATLRPLLLTTYKSLAKQFTRDASLAGKLKADVAKTYKDVERWIADNSLGGGIRGGKKEEEARERALEAVAEILWEEGGLVPLAKKKRPSTRSPGLPTELRALWMPLISHFDNLYDGALSETITRRGVDLLCTTSGGEGGGIDRTYAACVVAWVAELLKDAPLGEIAALAEERGANMVVEEDDDDDDDEESGAAKELTIKNVLRTCLLSRSLQCVFRFSSLDCLGAAIIAGKDAQAARRVLVLNRPFYSGSAIPLIETLLADLSSEQEERADLDLVDGNGTLSSRSLSSRIKSLLPLLRAQALVGTPSLTAVEFGRRKVGSLDEASQVVREMETRAEETFAQLQSRAARVVIDRRNNGGEEELEAAAANISQGGGGGGGQGGEDAEMSTLLPPLNDGEAALAATAAAVATWEPVQLWTKRPIGTLPKGGVLALDLAPVPALSSSA